MNHFCHLFLALALFPATIFAQFEYRTNWRQPPTTFKPYVIKLMTPGGVNVLRDIPLDHLHHHGLMFAIKIDDVNFWEEYNPKDFGRQETTSVTQVTAGTDGRNEQRVESTLTWADGVGRPLALEKRTITATVIDGATVLDWTSVFTLPPGKEQAILSGNEYHGLGMRFVQSMDIGRYFVAADAGKKEGNLTRCRWMAYTAKADGKTVTVALFDMEDNQRPMLAFSMGGNGREFAYLSATTNLHREPMTLTQQKPITFRYKLVLWDGEKTPEDIEGMKIDGRRRK